MTPKETAEFACKVLYDKKGSDIITLEIADMTIITDYFVIASAHSTTQVKALANYVDEKFSEIGIEPLRREGMSEGRWAVLDYGSIIVHIFHDETRMFYCLERLWNNGTNIEKYQGE